MAAAIVLFLLYSTLPLIASMGYHNLALRSLSVAVTTEQPQELVQAEEYARQAMAYDPRAAGRLAYRLGIAKQQFALSDEAFGDFQEALLANNLPESVVADLLFQVGVYYREMGKRAEATKYLQRLLAMDISRLPTETVAHANVHLGMILVEEGGNLLVARQYLDEALALLLDPLTMDRYLALITKIREQGGEEYLAQALEMAIYATERQPSSTWPALIRCDVHLDRGEMVEATTWCQRAITLDQNNHRAHVAMGNTYARQGLWQEALDEYEIAVALAPTEGWYQTLAENARANTDEE